MSLSVKNTLGGGGANAPYAWAKYEVYNATGSVTFAQKSRVDGAYEISVTSTEIDTTKLKASDFVGIRLDYESGGYGIVFYADGVCKLENSSGTASGTYSYTYDAIEGIITTTNKFTDDLTFISPTKTVSANDMTFVEYVTDKSPTKYPNGEVHTDGFFYRYAPEGLYAWKKHSVSVLDNLITKSDKNYILGTAASDTTVYYSTSYTFDASTGMYTLVNPQSATLTYNGSGGVASVQMEKSKYYIWGATSSNEIYNTNANSKYNVAIRNASGTVYLELNASDYKCDIHSAKAEYTFLDYIVSDKENAYPDGGEKGGYWYEKVSNAKMASGSITPSSSPTNLVIEHGLGKTPKQFYLLLNEADFTSYRVVVSAYKNDIGHRVSYASPTGGGIYNAYAESSEESPETIFDETNITVPTCYSSANKNSTSYQVRYYGVYKWFAIAE